MKQVAVFAGSFDPYTIGHEDIFNQAEAVFGKGNVLLALGHNSEKKYDFDREVVIKNSNPEINVVSYKGFLDEFVTSLENEGYDVTLVRGLRNGDDLQYEQNQLAFIRDFKPDIKVVYFLSNPNVAHVSSSAVRAIEKMNKERAEKFKAKQI
jgi:pantetheine-phosphate adenylyltransferase